MARECEVCGKKTQTGNSIETRGKAKYLGGVGTKVTGITRRKFKPNLQRIKITTPHGATRRAGFVLSASVPVPCTGRGQSSVQTALLTRVDRAGRPD
ncbi:MAG: 50S ribosomal protein L28 [Pirellulaceae bacterium]